MADPLKKLDHYDRNDEDVFYGRDFEIRTVSETILSHPVTVLTGESGSGKTSLILAGIIPVLQKQRKFERIEYSTASQLKEKGFLDRLDSDPGTGHLFIFDQFEDAVSGETDRYGWLLDLLSRSGGLTGKNGGNLHFLFAMRSDYLPPFLDWIRPLRTHFLAEQFFYLRRFAVETATEVLDSLLKAHDVSIGMEGEQEICERLSGIDAEGEVYPPHLQIVANHLIQMKQESNQHPLTSGDDWDVESILTSYFDRGLFSGFTSEEETLVRDLFELLVGREGLRRKWTVEEICSRIKLDPGRVKPILNQLLDRRSLRLNRDKQTGEERYELIHDFLSRHFFAAFSRKKRDFKKLQDMFHQAFLDYRDDEVLLDEKRLRMFLHHRDELSFDEDEFDFMVRSVVGIANGFFYDFSTYVTVDMLPSLLRMVEGSTDPGAVINSIAPIASDEHLDLIEEKIRTTADGASKSSWLSVLLQLNEQRAFSLMHEVAAENGPFWTEILEGTHYSGSLSPDLAAVIFDFLLGNEDAEILSSGGELLQRTYSFDAMEYLLILLREKKGIDPHRYISNFYSLYRSVEFPVVSEFTSGLQSMHDSISEILRNSIDHCNDRNFQWESYFYFLKPSLKELRECFRLLTDPENQQGFFYAFPDDLDGSCVDFLVEEFNRIENHAVRTAIVSALSRFSDEKVAGILSDMIFSTTEKNIQRDAFRLLHSTAPERAYPIAHEAIRNGDVSGMDEEILASISKKGDANDFVFLEKLMTENSSSGMKEKIFYAIKNSDFDPDQQIDFLRKYFNETKDSCAKSEIAGKMVSLGDRSIVPYCLEILHRADRLIKPKSEFAFSLMSSESVLFILAGLMDAPDSILEEKAFLKASIEIARNSGVQSFANQAFHFLLVRYGSDPDTQRIAEWLLHDGRFLSQRSLAAVARCHPDNGDQIFDEIFKVAESSPFEQVRLHAMIGLGVFHFGSDDPRHRKRISLFARMIGGGNLEAAKRALALYGSCAEADDLPLLLDAREVRSHALHKRIDDYNFFMQIDRVLRVLETPSSAPRSLIPFCFAPFFPVVFGPGIKLHQFFAERMGYSPRIEGMFYRWANYLQGESERS